jgi:hypothetical protein
VSKIVTVIRRRRALLALTVASAFVAGSIGTVTHASDPSTASAASLAGYDPPEYEPYDFTPARHQRPKDRYEPAGGCYVARSEATGKYLTRTGSGFAATGATGEPLHFQALDLGKYLLYAGKADFVAAEADPAPGGARPATDAVAGYVKGTSDESLNPAREPVLGALDAVAGASDEVTAPVREGIRGTGIVAAAEPSAAAEWVLRPVGKDTFAFQLPVDDGQPENPGPLDPPIAGTLTAGKDGALSVAAGKVATEAAQFSLRLADGCAVFPEAQLNVSGPHATGSSPYDEVQGYFDGHLHGMAFEFLGGRARCGRPWHPYGITYALVDCPDHEPGGRGAILEDVLSGGTPGQGHDTTGWPTFGYWPNNHSLTHEQVYYAWLERAWLGGLRMFTNLLVDNGQLCEIYPYKKNSCNEMDGVRLQAQRLHELIRYIDAQSGGPGEGWLQIAKDPFEARSIINAGKLAVVMGIEVSVPLDCGEYLGTPKCNAAEIDQRLQEVYNLGVRQMEMTNKFDNALTGVTGDDGATGLIVNEGNKGETGHFWQMQTCANPKDPRHDKQQYNLADESGGNLGRDAIFGAVLEVSGASGAAPVYPAGPHCNTIGLSDLGKAFLGGMMKRGMLFDPDHMSVIARKQALDLLEKAQAEGHHPGVIYPFTGLGGVRIDKQVTGKHTWDINTEGVDHYGLYPDWVQDATILAGAQGAEFKADIERGAEAFLQMWERAVGVHSETCVDDGPPRGKGQVKVGMTPAQVLLAAGQPQRRSGDRVDYVCSLTGQWAVTFVDGKVARVS